MHKNPFSLLLFTTSTEIIREAEPGGIAGVIVDWENQDKHERQTSYDTQINSESTEDITRVKAAFNGPVICRVNNHADRALCFSELDTAINNGADEVLLPMVRTPHEVEAALEHISDRSRLSIMVETVEAVRAARELSSFPLSSVYVGLNDLAIDRGSRNIFSAVADGTVDEIRKHFSVPFGFAGLTLPDLGSPIPCMLLISEMARLKCSMTFLRRSFLADTREINQAQAVIEIHNALNNAFQLGAQELENNRQRLIDAIRALNAER